MFLVNWFRHTPKTRPASRPVRLSVVTLEGRAVPSRGVPDLVPEAPNALVAAVEVQAHNQRGRDVQTPANPTAGDTGINALGVVDNHRQRGYPIPPTATPKPPEISVRPKPVIVLPPAQPVTTTATAITAAPTPVA